MRPPQVLLQHIWNAENYKILTIQIEKHIHDTVKKCLPRLPYDEYQPTEHRIEDLIRQIAAEEKLGGIHTGMTSSDIEDNVRLYQLYGTVNLLQDELSDVIVDLGKFVLDERDTVISGRTHLIPAQFTTLGYRFAPSLESLLEAFLSTPRVVLKGVGGVVGTRSVFKELKVLPVLPWDLDEQVTCNQTSNMLSEYRFVCWCNLIGAVMSKIALDLRLMFGSGQITSGYKDVGSSALAAKKPNPYRLERICGRARELTGYINVVTQDIASNALERTLDNQTNLHEILPRVASIVLDIFDDFTRTMETLKVEYHAIKKENTSLHRILSSEAIQLALLKSGKYSRGWVQKTVNNYYNGAKSFSLEEQRIIEQNKKAPPMLGDVQDRLDALFNLLFSVLPHKHPKWRAKLKV